MHRYFRIWKRLTINAFGIVFYSQWGASLFLIGKMVRFGLYISFLILLVSHTRALSGYSIWEVLLFYMTFQLVDTTTQMLFREVYRFRGQIVSGNFDLILVKPMPVLLRALLGGTDILDLITLVPFSVMTLFILVHIPSLSVVGLVLYVLFFMNALIIAMAFHIGVLALSILTTEIDHALMIYRDVTAMGRVPVEVYGQPLRSFITFVIPVGIMMSYPVHAFVGKLTLIAGIAACAISAVLLTASVSLWRMALRRYTSFTS